MEPRQYLLQIHNSGSVKPVQRTFQGHPNEVDEMVKKILAHNSRVDVFEYQTSYSLQTQVKSERISLTA